MDHGCYHVIICRYIHTSLSDCSARELCCWYSLHSRVDFSFAHKMGLGLDILKLKNLQSHLIISISRKMTLSLNLLSGSAQQ